MGPQLIKNTGDRRNVERGKNKGGRAVLPTHEDSRRCWGSRRRRCEERGESGLRQIRALMSDWEKAADAEKKIAQPAHTAAMKKFDARLRQSFVGLRRGCVNCWTLP